MLGRTSGAPSRRPAAVTDERAALLEDIDDLERILDTPVPSRQRELIHQMIQRKREAYDHAHP
jgi:hypothetical protein